VFGPEEGPRRPKVGARAGGVTRANSGPPIADFEEAYARLVAADLAFQAALMRHHPKRYGVAPPEPWSTR